MARPKSHPKLRHHKARDLAVVRVDGKDHHLVRFGSAESVEKYNRVVGEWMARGADKSAAVRGGDGVPNPTVNEVILAYVAFGSTYFRRPDGSPGSEPAVIRLAARPLRALYGSTQARDFGPVALKAVRQSMIDTGLARRTVNQRIGQIVRMFGHAVENEMIPADVHLRLSRIEPFLRASITSRTSSTHTDIGGIRCSATKEFMRSFRSSIKIGPSIPLAVSMPSFSQRA